jgi:uncharacterized damage-inducible protein DinB
MDLDYMISHWANVRTALLETIDKFSDEELDFRPYPTAWTVRQLMLHIAHEEHGEFDYGILQTLEAFPEEYNVLDYRSVEAIKALLEATHAETLGYLEKLAPGDLERVIVAPWGPSYRLIAMIGHIVEHEIHHRAELSLILGLLGKGGLNA